MSWVSDAAVRRLRVVATWPDFAGSRYSVVREIGRGGMGTVFLGRDEELGREVAIKVTNSIDAGGAPEERMRAEARILASLEHPGIVPIHDLGTLGDGRVFTVMKLVRGATLTDALAGTPALDARVRVFERLCEAVAFAHARGTVHRDLKPSNVMVGPFGEVLVMDWGIAKALSEGRRASSGGQEGNAADEVRRTPGTDPGVVMGTRGYMAPEQAANARDVDARADVYSLGGILFGMITCEEPPEDAGQARAALSRFGTVPKRLRAICARAMAADRTGRYAHAAELADDLARLRAGQPVVAWPETPLDRLGRVVTTYQTPILLVAAYLIVRALIAYVFRI